MIHRSVLPVIGFQPRPPEAAPIGTRQYPAHTTHGHDVPPPMAYWQVRTYMLPEQAQGGQQCAPGDFKLGAHFL